MTFRTGRGSLPLFALLLALAACNSGAPGTNGGSAAVSNGSAGNSGGGAGNSSGGGGGGAAVISASDNPHEAMMKAVRAHLDARSYRAHVTTSVGGGPENNMVIDYFAPDRFRAVMEAPAGGPAAGQKREFIIVGNAAYIQGPDGRWVRSPVGVADIARKLRDPKMLEDMAKVTDVRLVGPEMLDGTPTLVYQYTQNSVMGMDMKSNVKTWLAVSDGLPRKTEAEGEYNGQKTKTRMTISDINSDIKIEAPIK